VRASGVPHPHEDTGRGGIYVNRLMTVGVEGMPQAEARRSNAVSTTPRSGNSSTSVWRLGDLLLGQPLLLARTHGFPRRSAA
jgi:hypothetical protein